MANDQLAEFLMGPLSEKYCDIFYFIGIFVLLSILLGICMIVYMIISGTKISSGLMMTWIANLIVYFIVYLENRILYNMCKKAL
jgi:hypothetical protein